MKRKNIATILIAGTLLLAGAVTATLSGDWRLGPPLRQLAEAPDLSPLRRGMDAVSSDAVQTALDEREKMPIGSLDHQLLTWAIAVYGGGGLPTELLLSLRDSVKDWPAQRTIRHHLETALSLQTPDAATVIAAIGDHPPQTMLGAIALANAHTQKGDEEAARSVLGHFWRTTKLGAKDELNFLSRYATRIDQTDFCYRQEYMLYEDRIASAERSTSFCGQGELVAAWAAVIRRSNNAGALLESVPEDQRGAGYAYAKARHLRQSGQFAEAAEIMAGVTRNPEELIDLDQWWFERKALARELFDQKKYRAAYQLASGQIGGKPASVAEAEFYSGWLALRFLDEPETAARHFSVIARIADGPISNARAQYWLGRAVQAGAQGDANAYFRAAAHYGTTFYGQLASAVLGDNTINIMPPEPDEEDRTRFSQRVTVQAIERLEQIGHGWRNRLLIQELAQELHEPGEIRLLAEKAARSGGPYLVLRVGKLAAARGLDAGALAFPTDVFDADFNLDKNMLALVYAIARQESEFNANAVSPASARGLLQLMPATARETAQRLGVDYSSDRLASDAAYNTLLGSAYLKHQREQFDGSYILTFIAYNAGPRRAREWIERNGDPRQMQLNEIVDWLETIPFAETRNYVQRVMENLQVYNQLLKGKSDILADLSSGETG